MLTDRSGSRRVAVLRQKTLAQFKATDPTLFAGGSESTRVESVHECCSAQSTTATSCLAPCREYPQTITFADNTVNIIPELVSDPSAGYFWLLATGDYYEDTPPCSSFIYIFDPNLPPNMIELRIYNEVTQDVGVFVETGDIPSITFPLTISVVIVSTNGNSITFCGGSNIYDPITFTLAAPS